jgi:hypothetical protein
LDSKDGDQSDDEDVPKPSRSKSGKTSKKKSSKSEKKHIAPSPEPSPKETEDLGPEDHVSPIHLDLSSSINLCDNPLLLMSFQPDSTSGAIEVTTTSEKPKPKESRKKRKHKTQEITVETTHTDGSPVKSSPKRRKQGHKNSNPNNTQSCVGDNVSKVIYLFNAILNIFYFMLF